MGKLGAVLTGMRLVRLHYVTLHVFKDVGYCTYMQVFMRRKMM